MISFINIFRKYGFKYFESPHLLNRGANDDWGNPELKTRLKKVGYYSDEGKNEIASIIKKIRDFTEKYKLKNQLVGAILIPVALFINGFANLTLSPDMQKASPLVPALQSNWLMMHVSMMMLSYATLIMGSLLCILFLVISKYQDVDLQLVDESSLPLYNVMLDYYEAKLFSPSDEISELGKLKLLQSLDNWSYRIIGLGFPFLTIGIIAGGVWANEAWGSYWSWDPKETWALITWIVFATYLHSRITKGWEGKKTAILGGAGFFVIWICYLGVNFLGKGLHTYGQII